MLKICTEGSSNYSEILTLLSLGVNVDVHVSHRVTFMLLLSQLKFNLWILQDDLGNTALMFACYNGHTEIASVLLDHHASVNKQNKVEKL